MSGVFENFEANFEPIFGNFWHFFARLLNTGTFSLFGSLSTSFPAVGKQFKLRRLLAHGAGGGR